MGVVRVHDLTDLSSVRDVDVEAEIDDRVASFRAAVEASFIMAKVPTVKLNSGYEMPLLGLGTWKSDAENEVYEAVKAAIECGYRHIDCAKIYENEQNVGKALQYCMTYGGVKREDLFVTSKLWNADHAKADVRNACLKTMADLQLDYLDLYLVHWPETGNTGPVMLPTTEETWLEMEALVQEGLVRSVGISNFTVKKIEEMKRYWTIIPAVNQIELHPYLRQDALVEYCKGLGMHVTAYSPLGTPDSALIFNRTIAPSLLYDPAVVKIGEKLGRTAAQVLIRWALQRGTSVIPKSSKPARIKSNIDVLDWELPEEDFKFLASFEIQYRFLSAAVLLKPEGPYKTLTELWDDPEEDLLLEKYIRTLYDLEAPCPRTEIAPGLHMPQVGLGTWRSEPNQIREAVLSAVHSGYRHIDCAEIYQNEHEVGEALKRIFEEGLVKREDLWLTSKLWNANHAKDDVAVACKKSLANLKLDYLDLYLMHWPVAGNVGPEVVPSIKETWQAMEALVDVGLVKAIGVSNFSTKKMQEILSYARIKPAVCQVEIHAYFRNDALIEWCGQNKIHVTAYSALGGAPDTERMVGKTLPKLMENTTVEEIADRLGKSKGQHGTSVLAKSINPERIKMNYDVFDWELSPEDYGALSALEPQIRLLDGSFFTNPAGPYTSVAELWDE